MCVRFFSTGKRKISHFKVPHVAYQLWLVIENADNWFSIFSHFLGFSQKNENLVVLKYHMSHLKRRVIENADHWHPNITNFPPIFWGFDFIWLWRGAIFEITWLWGGAKSTIFEITWIWGGGKSTIFENTKLWGEQGASNPQISKLLCHERTKGAPNPEFS